MKGRNNNVNKISQHIYPKKEWRRPMTDKKWVIICDCTWCNGEGETYDNDPTKKAEECRECEGHGIEEFYENSDQYENEEEVREDYKSKDILFVALVK